MAASLQPYTLEEMERRMRKAERYVATRSGLLTQSKNFLRDKSREYFDEITTQNNGIMEPYMKDDHGDHKSPINNNIKGLFFSTDADVMASSSSIYGPVQLTVQVSTLIDSNIKAYFADFYCVPGRGNRPHYITIVLTRVGSDTDRFCRRHLPELPITNNRFFTVDLLDEITVSATTGNLLHVEIFYTEPVNINHLISTHQATLADVPVARPGAQYRKPRAKSDNCPHCG